MHTDHYILSLHDALPILLFTCGTTLGIWPSSYCASATSCSHFVKKPATFMLKLAVRTKTCASPVHPRRSSRCGQSVGIDRKSTRLNSSHSSISYAVFCLK